MRRFPLLVIALLGITILQAVTIPASGMATPPGPPGKVTPHAGDPPLALTFKQFVPTDTVQPGFWGLNVRGDNKFGTFQGNEITATGVNYLRFPGGTLGERYNYTSNRITSDSGSTSTATTSVAQFVAQCIVINCKAILQLPTEINSSSTAAYYVNYVESTLGFHPSFWEVGNEPSLWSHYNIPWVSWSSGDATNTTPVAFGQEVLRYSTAIRNIDPNAHIIALGGNGQGSGNDIPWIKQIVKYSGQNLSGVSIHTYVDGNGPGTPTLTGFFRGVNATASAYAIPNLLPADRAAIISQCPTCTGLGLYITEIAAANSGGSYAPYLPTFDNALFVAAQITQEMVFNLTNGDYFVLNNSFPGAWFINTPTATPTYSLYKYILNQLGPTILNGTVTSAAGSVYAVETANATGQQVLVANLNLTQTLSLNLSGTGFPTVGHGTVIQWNGNGTPTKTTWSGTLGTYSIPPLSLFEIGGIPSNPSGITQPAARSQGLFVWDQADGYYVLFGGINDTTGNVYRDTWTLNGGSWTNVTSGAMPPTLFGSYACYDGSDGYVVLFGGYRHGYVATQLTWKYLAGVWTNITGSVGTQPAASGGGSMTFDQSNGYCLWFGGSTSAEHQTWVFSHNVWVQAHPTSTPPARTNASLAYYPGTGDVLFGGLAVSNGSPLSDTWFWNGGNWVKPGYGTIPSARMGGRMALDTGDNYLVLFGGYDGTKALSDTWAFTGGGWTNLTGALSTYPSISGLGQMASNSSAITLWSGNTFTGSDIQYLWYFQSAKWTRSVVGLVTPPSNFKITARTATSITMSWVNPTTFPMVNDIVTYGVSPNSSCAFRNNSVTLSVQTTGKISGLLPLTYYSFAVIAVAQTPYFPTPVQSSPSVCLTNETLSAVPPAPTNVRALNSTASSIMLAWTNPISGGVINNTVWYGTVCGFWSTVSTSGAVGAFNLTGLNAATTYCIAVSASNTTGTGPISAQVLESTKASSGGGGGGSSGGGSGTTTPSNKTTPPTTGGLNLSKIIQLLFPNRLTYQLVAAIMAAFGFAIFWVTRKTFPILFLMTAGVIFVFATFGTPPV